MMTHCRLMFLLLKNSKAQNINVFAFLVLISMFVYACESGNSTYKTNLRAYVESKTNVDSVFIIPASGCSGCIDKTINFSLRNQSSKNTFYIFTRINDFKLLKADLKINPEFEKNFYFDRENEFSTIGYKDIYPQLFIRKNKNKFDIIAITPDYSL